MQKKVMVDGTSFSLFKGNFASVIRRVANGKKGWEVRFSSDGKRVKRCFPFAELRAANDYARAKEAERSAHGQFAVLREVDRLAVAFYHRWEQVYREQERNVPPLLDLVQEACARYDARLHSASWKQAADDFVLHRCGHLKQQRMKIIRSVISRVSSRVPEDTLLDDVSVGDLQSVMNDMLANEASVATRRYYLGVLSSIWKYAQERGVARLNPAAEALKRLPSVKSAQQPSFLSVEQCRALLEVALRWGDRKEALFFVVGLLTGIRLAERTRLQFADFRLDEAEPYINVPAGKAKTLRQRAVYLQGNHAEIIRAFLPTRWRQDEFVVPYGGNEVTQRGCAYARQQAFAREAGVELPRNVLRHTAATYLCAYLESMGKAALILGHSEAILIRHYRALVTRVQAVPFFSMPLPGCGE